MSVTHQIKVDNEEQFRAGIKQFQGMNPEAHLITPECSLEDHTWLRLWDDGHILRAHRKSNYAITIELKETEMSPTHFTTVDTSGFYSKYDMCSFPQKAVSDSTLRDFTSNAEFRGRGQWYTAMDNLAELTPEIEALIRTMQQWKKVEQTYPHDDKVKESLARGVCCECYLCEFVPKTSGGSQKCDQCPLTGFAWDRRCTEADSPFWKWQRASVEDNPKYARQMWEACEAKIEHLLKEEEKFFDSEGTEIKVGDLIWHSVGTLTAAKEFRSKNNLAFLEPFVGMRGDRYELGSNDYWTYAIKHVEEEKFFDSEGTEIKVGDLVWHSSQTLGDVKGYMKAGNRTFLEPFLRMNGGGYLVGEDNGGTWLYAIKDPSSTADRIIKFEGRTYVVTPQGGATGCSKCAFDNKPCHILREECRYNCGGAEESYLVELEPKSEESYLVELEPKSIKDINGDVVNIGDSVRFSDNTATLDSSNIGILQSYEGAACYPYRIKEYSIYRHILKVSEQDVYLKNHNESGFKVGDRVKVIRKAERRENGWQNGWTVEMTNVLEQEKVLTIHGPGSASGFPMKEGYSYPYYCLEKVEPTKVGDYVQVDEIYGKLEYTECVIPGTTYDAIVETSTGKHLVHLEDAEKVDFKTVVIRGVRCRSMEVGETMERGDFIKFYHGWDAVDGLIGDSVTNERVVARPLK